MNSRPKYILLIVFSFSILLPKCTKKKLTPNGFVATNQYDTVIFSNEAWLVKGSVEKTGPGPNYWDSKNVRVDNTGGLHLRINRDSLTGHWRCAEIISLKLFGYGTYEFSIANGANILDKNVVLGLFNYSGNDGFDEMDIEVARWDFNNHPNLYYSVWPAYNSNGTKWTNASFFDPPSTYTIHRFTRTPHIVMFQSLGLSDSGTIIQNFSQSDYDSASISRVPMSVHINLWLYRGNAPTTGNDVEIVIRSFKYFPL